MKSDQECNAERAVALLQLALEHAKAAQAPKTADRIRLALSSARGAVRAAGYRARKEANAIAQKKAALESLGIWAVQS